jgi:hypothetical protein
LLFCDVADPVETEQDDHQRERCTVDEHDRLVDAGRVTKPAPKLGAPRVRAVKRGRTDVKREHEREHDRQREDQRTAAPFAHGLLSRCRCNSLTVASSHGEESN